MGGSLSRACSACAESLTERFRNERFNARQFARFRVKHHPTFVSDALEKDVDGHIASLASGRWVLVWFVHRLRVLSLLCGHWENDWVCHECRHPT